MRVRIFGDSSLAARWIPWAKHKFNVLRQSMRLSGISQGYKTYTLEGGNVRVFLTLTSLVQEVVIVAMGGEAFVLASLTTGAPGGNLKLYKLRRLFDSPREVYTAGTATFAYDPSLHVVEMFDSSGAIVYGTKTVAGDAAVADKAGLNGGGIWTYSVPSGPGEETMFLGAGQHEGMLYLAGYRTLSGGLRQKLLLSKLDYATGAVKWSVERYEQDTPHLFDDTTILANGLSSTPQGIFISGQRNNVYLGNVWFVERVHQANGFMLWIQSMPQIEDGEILSESASFGVQADSSGVYAVGFRKRSGVYKKKWRVERRDAASGTEIWHQTYASANDAIAVGTTLDVDAVYVYGTDGTYGRLEKRSKSNGSLLWSITFGDFFIRNIKMMDGKLIAFGYDSVALTHKARIVKVDDGTVEETYSNASSGFIDDGIKVVSG